jgi:hypothetical protein
MYLFRLFQSVLFWLLITILVLISPFTYKLVLNNSPIVDHIPQLVVSEVVSIDDIDYGFTNLDNIDKRILIELFLSGDQLIADINNNEFWSEVLNRNIDQFFANVWVPFDSPQVYLPIDSLRDLYTQVSSNLDRVMSLPLCDVNSERLLNSADEVDLYCLPSSKIISIRNDGLTGVLLKDANSIELLLSLDNYATLEELSSIVQDNDLINSYSFILSLFESIYRLFLVLIIILLSSFAILFYFVRDRFKLVYHQLESNLRMGLILTLFSFLLVLILPNIAVSTPVSELVKIYLYDLIQLFAVSIFVVYIIVNLILFISIHAMQKIHNASVEENPQLT